MARFVQVLLLLASLSGFIAPDCLAQTARDNPYKIGIEGKITPRGFHLKVRYDSGANPVFDALRVYSLPSETLLLVHYDSKRDRWPEQGLSTSQGNMTAFQHEVVLPRDWFLQLDTKISVRLVKDGEEIVVSEGSVDLTDFQVSSRFGTASLSKRSGSISQIGNCGANEWEHCSGGPRCTYGCICCDSAYFCANLITCNMVCGDVEDC
jgi:hypothetical protein